MLLAQIFIISYLIVGIILGIKMLGFTTFKTRRTLSSLEVLAWDIGFFLCCVALGPVLLIYWTLTD